MSVESVKKWVDILPIGESPTGKTKIWGVKSYRDEGSIGIIKWHGAWRKYVYHSDEAFYDWDCLRLIANFCEEQTLGHQHIKK